MVKRFLSPAGTCRTIRVKEQPARVRAGSADGGPGRGGARSSSVSVNRKRVYPCCQGGGPPSPPGGLRIPVTRARSDINRRRVKRVCVGLLTIPVLGRHRDRDYR